MIKNYTMHVINGTHWDREWRHTAEQSKLRLCDLMDNIINILETDEEYKCFCVDGGMIVIEDYLSIRPENKERIKKLIQAKKMLVVNWYTLPETNTVAPEALIRNLLVGFRMSKEFGGGMKSGYTATSYGQHSQMPQLYQGFGIETAIFYRGTNKHVLTPLFKWQGIDGSQLLTLRTFDEVTRTNWFFYVHGPVVLGKGIKDLSYTYDRENDPVHMCDQGLYEKAFVLLREDHDYCHDEEVMKKALDSIVKQAMPYAIADNLLALNMEDNDEPYKSLPNMIKEMNKLSDNIEIIQNSLDDYMDKIISEVDDKDLALHRGELRYTTMEYNNFNALLGATHSSRIKLKQLNEKVETNLIHLAEPFAAFAAFFGKEYPKTNLSRAWEALLKNHAHDSICGAAVDLAHEDMLYNFSIANTVAEEVTSRSVIALYSKINTSEDFKHTDHTITLFNTLPYGRKEVVPLIIDLPKVSTGIKVDTGVDGVSSVDTFYDIFDKAGNLIPYTEVSCEDIKIAVERELDTKAIKFSAKRRRILIEADIPAMGYTTYALRLRGPNLVYHPEIVSDRQLIARDNGLLENKYLKLKINVNGTFSLLNKTTGRWMENLHYFTDSGETGSAHVSVKPQRNPIITSHGSFANITLVETNIHRGCFKVELSIKVPAAATIDGKDRLRQMLDIPITYWITLEKDTNYVRIKTRLHNEARDHKLCVNFPSGIKTDYATCESAWAVEKRTIRWTDNGDNFEQFFPFQPMQNFVDVNDGKEGLAILNRGLREYEVQDDPNRTISITLLRTQRAYMTANPDMIPEEYDKYTGQHSFGDLEYNYALYPHTGEWDEGRVLQTAYEFKVDIKAIQGVTIQGELPSTTSLIKVTPEEKIMLSSLKLAEDGKGTVLRLWNTTAENQKVEVSTILPVKAVKRLRMDESQIGDIEFINGSFVFEMGPHKIETFLLLN